MATLVETPALLDVQPKGMASRRGLEISGPALLTGSLAVRWMLRLTFVLLAARVLGPGRFGIYALLYTMTEFLAVASGSGYADYLTREAAKDARSGWGLAGQLVLLRILIAIPVAGAEIGFLALLGYSKLVLAGMACMALTLVPRSISEAIQGTLRGIRQCTAYLAVEIILGASLVAGAGFLLLQHGGMRVVIASEAAASVAACVGALAWAWKSRPRETRGLKIPHLLKSSVVFNGYSFLASLYDRFDVVLLSKLAGDYATGVYSVAYRALGMTQILAYGVLYSLLPAISGNARGWEERRRLEKSMGFLLGAACAVVLATLVLAGPAVRVLLGSGYAEAATALKILIWAVLLRYMNCALNIVLLASGQEKLFLLTSAVCLGVNLAGNLILIPFFSWRAAAVMTVVTEMVLLLQNLYWVRKRAGGMIWPRFLKGASVRAVDFSRQVS